MTNALLKHKPAVMAAASVLAAMATLSSCDHKELCYDHDAHSPKFLLRVEASYQQEWELGPDGTARWKDFPAWEETYGRTYDMMRPAIPEGLRMHDFPVSGPSDMINMKPMGETVGMRPGEHQLLFYNNDTEYIVFDDMYSSAAAKATTRTRTRSTYMGNPFNNYMKENTVNMPDMLYGNYNKSYTSERSTEVTEMNVTMHPLVFKYLVRYEFSKGLEYVAIVRGALSGMASSVYLQSGNTSPETATLLYDCTLEPWGGRGCGDFVRSTRLSQRPIHHHTRAAEQLSQPGGQTEERCHKELQLRRDRPDQGAAARRSNRGERHRNLRRGR